MSERRDDDAEQEWEAITGRPALDASGRIERLEPPGSQLPPPSQPPPPPAPEQGEEPLELARDIRREEPPPAAFVGGFEAPPPRRSWGAIVAVVVLVFLGAGALLFGDRLGRPAGGDTPFVLISSDPSGASIRLGDRIVGTTPWSTGNVWPEGPVPFELRLDGYEPYRGRFQGAREQIIEARLRTKRR